MVLLARGAQLSVLITCIFSFAGLVAADVNDLGEEGTGLLAKLLIEENVLVEGPGSGTCAGRTLASPFTDTSTECTDSDEEIEAIDELMESGLRCFYGLDGESVDFGKARNLFFKVKEMSAVSKYERDQRVWAEWYLTNMPFEHNKLFSWTTAMAQELGHLEFYFYTAILLLRQSKEVGDYYFVEALDRLVLVHENDVEGVWKPAYIAAKRMQGEEPEALEIYDIPVDLISSVVGHRSLAYEFERVMLKNLYV